MRLLVETGALPDGRPGVRVRCGTLDLWTHALAADLAALQPGVYRLKRGLVLRGRPPEVHTVRLDDEEPVLVVAADHGDPVVQAVDAEVGPQHPPAGQDAPALDPVERLIDELESVVACLRRAYDADLAGRGLAAVGEERRHAATAAPPATVESAATQPDGDPA